MRLQQRFHHLTALVAREVAALRRDDRHARILRDDFVEALLAVVRGGRARRAFEFDDLRLAAGRLDEPVSGAMALIDEVRADERDVVAARFGHRLIDVAVDQDHRNAGLLRLQHDRCERLFFARREHQQIDVLRDHALNVRDLLGVGAVGVGHHDLPAALRGDVLEALGFRETPRIVAFGLREADLQRSLGGEFGQRVVGVRSGDAEPDCQSAAANLRQRTNLRCARACATAC